jgi:DNA invertase Pin-like site-specific DNA recombinase
MSIERQTQGITYTCKARGDSLVHITVDTDVSGAVSPFERDDLGPWLREPLVSQWDVIMVAKLDRLTRSLSHFDQFRQWCEENKKTIVSVSESLDLSTSTGRMFANLLAMFAQFERERMSERRKDAADKAKLDGRFDGRKSPFGYMAEPKTKRLIRDPVYAPIGAQMAAWRIEGRSYTWIASKLNDGGVKPRESDTWTGNSVLKMLSNPGLNGQITRRGKGRNLITVLRGDNGMPRKFTDDPIVNDTDWILLQKATERRTIATRQGGFLLTHAAFCGRCALPLYGFRKKGGYEYYRCRSTSNPPTSCGAFLIPLPDLESAVEDALMQRWGGRELYRRTVKPGKDYRAEIETVKAQIDALESENYTDPNELKVSVRMIAKLETELGRLKSLPIVEPGEDWTPAGITVREHYLSLDADDKNHLLERWGVRAVAKRDGKKDDLHLAVHLGDPGGFEQASGLVLRHEPDDHVPTYLVAGVLWRRLDDGTMEMLREPWKPEVMGMIRDWYDLTQGEPEASDAEGQRT